MTHHDDGGDTYKGVAMQPYSAGGERIREVNQNWEVLGDLNEMKILYLQTTTVESIPNAAWTAKTWTKATDVLRDDFGMTDAAGATFTDLTVPAGVYMTNGSGYYADNVTGVRGFKTTAVPGLIIVTAAEHDLGKAVSTWGMPGPLWLTDDTALTMFQTYQSSGDALDLEFASIILFQLKAGEVEAYS